MSTSSQIASPTTPCARCGLRPAALVHNATANGHDWSTTLPPIATWPADEPIPFTVVAR